MSKILTWQNGGKVFRAALPGELPEVQMSDALAAAKAEALARITTAAAAARRRIITDLPGQDMLYLRKQAEGVAWLADPAPDLARYPLIAAEIGITAETGDQIAQVWVNLARLWTEAAARFETIRLGAVARVEAATTPEAALDAADQAAAAF